MEARLLCSCEYPLIHVCVCLCLCVWWGGFSITYVPAEYLEEYKASLEQPKDDVFTDAAPVAAPALKYVPLPQ